MCQYHGWTKNSVDWILGSDTTTKLPSTTSGHRGRNDDMRREHANATGRQWR